MKMKYLLSLLALILSGTSARAASLLGESVTLTVHYSVFADSFVSEDLYTTTVTVGAGAEVSGQAISITFQSGGFPQTMSGTVTIDVGANTLSVNFSGTQQSGTLSVILGSVNDESAASITAVSQISATGFTAGVNQPLSPTFSNAGSGSVTAGFQPFGFQPGVNLTQVVSITLADAVASAPTVTSPTSASVTASTATLGGNVSSDGDATVTERGVVYSASATNSDPQIGGTGVTKVAGSGTTGVFTVGVTGLTAATSYSYKAYATNSVGTTYTSTGTFTTAVTIPGAPTGPSAVAGDGQATISFSVPASNGGAAITGYTVTASPGGFTGTGATSPVTVTGLTNGVAYTFTVTATNSAGTGSASAASNAVTPKADQTIAFANPGAQDFGTSPTLTATATSGLDVIFTSDTPGVATITSDGVLTFLMAGTATIDADQAGNSVFNAAPAVSRSFTVNAVVPGAPTVGTATAGDAQASVTFSAPLFTGGAAITGYTVTSSPEGLTGTGASSPVVVTGLTNGTAYTFTVTATNSAGTGSASVASNSVTPPPTVSSIERATGSPTNAASVGFTVVFSDGVTGVDADDFSLIVTGSATGTVAGVSAVNTSTYTVTVNAVSGDGTLQLDLKNSGTGIAGIPGNPIVTGFTTGQTYTIDNTVPDLVSIARQVPATVNVDAATATWRIAFDGGVIGVDVADFALSVLAGTPTGTVTSVTPVSASVYDVEVNALGGQGPLRLDLKAAATGIADLAGNAITDGGVTSGDFYIVGVADVFDTVSLAMGAVRSVSGAATTQAAQRFTTAAAGPLSLTTVTAALGAVTGTPVPAVTIHADNAGAIDPAVVATLTNPASLAANALNVWTSTALLSANTVYWVRFADTSVAGAYEIEETAATIGGSGTWLAMADYVYRHGVNAATGPQAGALQIALGATSTPAITSGLSPFVQYGTGFNYTITATNLPTSFAAPGLPPGLSLNPATGVISGTPTEAGTFTVALTATNGSGAGSPATLDLAVGPASLTISADSTSRSYGAANPELSFDVTGFVNGDTAAVLTTVPTVGTDATPTTPPGAFPIVVGSAVAPNYSITYVGGTLTITKAAQAITFTAPGEVILGQSATLSATSGSTLPVTLSVVSGPAAMEGSTLASTGVGAVTVRAAQAGNANFNAAPNVDRTVMVIVGLPVITTALAVPTPSVGGTATLDVVGSNPNVNYQWQRNGTALTGQTGSSLTLNDVQPPTAGLYTYTATIPGGGSGASNPVIVGLATTEKIIGMGEEVGANIVHPNGEVYNQVLLEGPAATVTANPQQITRVSFIDMSNDIVQIEFSGAGTLSLVMDNAATPAPAANYNQPGVDYVRGHAGIVITGANETTNLSVFTVGRSNAVNQTLFVDTADYDGVADIAFVAIQSTDGKFGGIRTGNVIYFATAGFTGVYAPGVELTGPMYVGNVSAFDSASPVLIVGSVTDARIAGGDLFQANGQPVRVSGLTQLEFVDGTTSHGVVLPAQANRGVLLEDGVEVTSQIVVNP